MKVITALRHRRLAAAALVLLSALLVGCAAFAVQYEREIEEAVLVDALDRSGVAGNALVISPSSRLRPDGTTTSPDEVIATIPAAVTAVYPQPTVRWQMEEVLRPVPGGDPYLVRIIAPDGGCRGLRLTSGSCPQRTGDVLVSEVTAQRLGLKLGQGLELTVGPDPARARLVGTFQQASDEAYWLGRQLEGRMDQLFSKGNGQIEGTDDWVTLPATIKELPDATFSVQAPLQRAALTVANLATTNEAVLDLVQRQGGGSSPLPSLTDSVARNRAQAQVVVPLLLGQLGVFALAVLIAVLRAYLGQRRAEVAVARLRGASPARATGWVVAEVGLLLALGAPLGLLLAGAAVAYATPRALVAGTPVVRPDWLWLVAAAVLLVELALVVIVTRPVTREGVLELLRQIPTRERSVWRPSAFELVIAVAAVGGLLGALTGGSQGLLALVTPTLLALLTGVIAGRLIAWWAAWWGARRLAGGRLTSGLAGVQLARRRSIRGWVVVMTAATALLVFAIDGVSVTARNRTDLARLRAGAAVVVTTDATDPVLLRDLVHRVDAGRRSLSVAARVVLPSSDLVTLGVEPETIGSILTRPSGVPAYDVSGLAFAQPVPRVAGKLAVVTIRSGQLGFAPTLAPQVAARALAGMQLTLRTQDGLGAANLIEVPGIPAAGGTARREVAVHCEKGCRINAVELETHQDPQIGQVIGDLHVTVTIDGRPLGFAAAWADTSAGFVDPTVPNGTAISGRSVADGLDLHYTLAWLNVARLTAPEPPMPAVLAGAARAAGGTGNLPSGTGLDGVTVALQPKTQLPAFPGGGVATAVVNYDQLLDRTAAIGARTSLQVWLRTPNELPVLRDALAGKGIHVRSTQSLAQEQTRLDHTAAAWTMSLALIVAGLAVLLSVLGLLVQAVSGRRDRGRERAVLELVGVAPRAAVLAFAAEHLAAIGAAVTLGAGVGVAGAMLALPQVPMFLEDPAPLVISLQPDLTLVLAAAGVALLALVAVPLATALRLRRERPTPSGVIA